MKIEILLGVMLPVGVSPLEPFPNPAAGVWDVFNDDLVLKRYNDKTPGNGLPQSEQERLAGTHAGTVTILRSSGPMIGFSPKAVGSSNKGACTGSKLCPTRPWLRVTS
jgi:hypothetical protein